MTSLCRPVDFFQSPGETFCCWDERVVEKGVRKTEKMSVAKGIMYPIFKLKFRMT